MQIDIAAPHFTLTDGIRDYVERRFGPLGRFDSRVTRTSVVIDRAMGRDNRAYVVKAHTSLPREGADVSAEGEELQAAIDAAAEKMEARLRKVHQRCAGH
jgi:ribosomal subunit interface protein